jgi:hypothetical protein
VAARAKMAEGGGELTDLTAVGSVVKAVPRLDFGDWFVAFPTKGRYEFLPSDSLQRTRAEPEEASGLWLGRTESGVSVVLPVKLAFRREGLRAVTLAVLHHGDLLTFAGHEVRFHETQRVRLGELASTAKYRCLQCRTRFESGGLVVQCPLCTGLYCDDCWTYLERRRCYSRGCRYSPVSLDAEATP